MKKTNLIYLISLICLLVLLYSLFMPNYFGGKKETEGISSTFASGKKREIMVYAGSGMQMPLDEIGRVFERQYGVRVLYDYAGSGRLGNKILSGQIPDVFIPGSEKWADILHEKGYVTNFFPVAYHTPVIITPRENNTIKALSDLTREDVRIVLGDAKAAAIGVASSIIFKKANLDESTMNIIARGMTVKQLILWIEGENADASIVWRADAVQSGHLRIIEIPDEWKGVYIIPVCQMMDENEAGSDYIDLCLRHEGKAIFARHGFNVVRK